MGEPLWGALVAIVLGFAEVAAGQARGSARTASRADEAEARALFEQGRAHAAEERWVEALEAFRRSRELVERPSTVFNVATTLVRLGRAQEALRTIADLERIADPRQHAQILRDAAEIRRQAEASLRHVTLRVVPADAVVEVDGILVPGRGTERTMVLDPGAHALVVTAEGHAAERFVLEPGNDLRDVALVPLDGTLHIVPSVDFAVVRVDGVERGTGRLSLTLPPGTYAVGITALGHVPYERSVDLAAGMTLTIDAALEPVPPEASVAESPLFWGLLGGGAAVLIGVGVALGVAFGTTEAPPYGGTSDTVVVPIVVP